MRMLQIQLDMIFRGTNFLCTVSTLIVIDVNKRLYIGYGLKYLSFSLFFCYAEHAYYIEFFLAKKDISQAPTIWNVFEAGEGVMTMILKIWKISHGSSIINHLSIDGELFSPFAFEVFYYVDVERQVWSECHSKIEWDKFPIS